MNDVSKLFGPAGILALVAFTASASLAQSYKPNYVPIGSFRTSNDVVQVLLDLNQPDTSAAGGVNAAVKVIIPSQDFYRRMAEPSDIYKQSVTDQAATYMSLGMGIDCTHNTAAAGHGQFYNAEDESIAGHDFGFVYSPILPNTLASVVAGKVCGH